MEEINYYLIIIAALVAIPSPGPATLAIAGMSMSRGRLYGLALASGVLTGSLIWSASTAFGLGAVLYSHAWIFEFIRYIGAIYLFYLALKSLQSAFRKTPVTLAEQKETSMIACYIRGLLLHLTNPKAILFFGALYSIGVTSTATFMDLLSVLICIGIISASVFLGYAVLFSSTTATRIYAKTKRVFEFLFAAVFGTLGFKLLTGELGK